MKSLIFLDDERFFSDVNWVNYREDFNKITVVRDYREFTEVVDYAVEHNELCDLAFSFDHDLGDNTDGYEKTGKTCAEYLIDLIIRFQLDPNDLTYFVHSKNPVGKENIEKYIQSYIDFYNKG